MEPNERVNDLLIMIGTISGLIANNRRQANEEIDRVKVQYSDGLKRMTDDLTTAERELESLVKRHRAMILAGADRADFPSGSVLLKSQHRVKQIKGMLERLKAEGLTDAVKVSREAVDWDKVEHFDDPTLSRLGTHRIEKEVFTYELKGGA